MKLKNLQQMQLKLLQKSNYKTAEARGSIIANKIADKIRKAKERNISPGERQ